MERILIFLRVYSNLLLFVGLQLLGMLLLIAYNDRHRMVFQDFSLALSGQVAEVRTGLFAYFDLAQQNEKLLHENQALHQEVIALKNKVYAYQNRVPNVRSISVVPDSLLPAYQFHFIPARSIGNSTSGHYNYILLNAGRRHGVQRDMGLLSNEGVAGMVVNVGEEYAVAMSALNKDFKLSAKVLHRGVSGTLSWPGGNTREAQLDYVPQHLRIQVGDTVATSAYSTLFPEDMLVGRVSAIEPGEQGGFHHIRVALATDFHRLNYVYLVRHTHWQVQDSLLRPFLRKQ